VTFRAITSDRDTHIELFLDRVEEGLLKHCHKEMSYLAGFLPGLYARESGHS
jgi:hypothetical protein